MLEFEESPKAEVQLSKEGVMEFSRKTLKKTDFLSM